MTVTPFHKLDEIAQTNGARANRDKQFSVEMPGEDWYSLLSILENAAEQSRNISEIRPLVTLSTQIRLILKGQGF